MNTLKLYVRNIIGEAIEGWQRVTINIDCFDAMRQSIFARKNRQTALLPFLRKTDERSINFTEFDFDGVVVRNYSLLIDLDNKVRTTAELLAMSKEEVAGLNLKRRTIFLMKPEDAKALLNSEKKESGSVLSFNLSTVAVV